MPREALRGESRPIRQARLGSRMLRETEVDRQEPGGLSANRGPRRGSRASNVPQRQAIPRTWRIRAMYVEVI